MFNPSSQTENRERKGKRRTAASKDGESAVGDTRAGEKQTKERNWSQQVPWQRPYHRVNKRRSPRTRTPFTSFCKPLGMMRVACLPTTTPRLDPARKLSITRTMCTDSINPNPDLHSPGQISHRAACQPRGWYVNYAMYAAAAVKLRVVLSLEVTFRWDTRSRVTDISHSGG